MDLIKVSFVSTFLLIFSTYAYAKSPLIRTSYVYANGGESLRELLENKVGIPSNILNEDGYFEKIKLWNSHLKNLISLMPNERIYVEIPYNVVLSPHQKKETNASSVHHAEQKVLVKENIQNDYDPDEQWSYSLFYALSRGSLQEGIPSSNITTNSSQDSPLTLGFSTNKKLSYELNYSASLYFSKLDGGLSNRNESVSLPWEYGLNSYIGLLKKSWPLEVYTGLDHERFSSYNTEELPFGAPLQSREHVLTFFTLGISKSFEWFGKQFLAKASYSSSFMSSQSRASTINPQAFEGTKFILYLNIKANKNWSYHGFYKQHDLVGATSLHMVRLGLGFGFTF